MIASRSVLVAMAAQKGLLNPRRRGGRWSEKLLTLTTPHLPGDTVSIRTTRLLASLVRFIRRLNRRWKAQDAHHSAHYVRAIEWTPGSNPVNDPAGHPHAHFWLFCPYLPQETLTSWWESALFEEGVPPSTKIIHVDVREVRNGPHAAKEVIKYLFKDLDTQGRKVPAETYAEVYMAFDAVFE